ncbi:penicillin-binding protein activator [Oleiagrimonas sp. C23AA]|uniref:penicillin-binding protein activator n=1 Tax=Oleiagrimonas sp. C23AA TaxID=2719047 RepID=UPI001422BC7F|nr:penicillin-binding protein activator [Oleiagrimonas sp. C23AA]NII09894.1 ABC transporter substrate-binding protein [Oleiagrimonas sp. C23AA]
MRLIRVLGLAAVLAAAGCATVSGPSPQQLARSQQVQSMLHQGNYDQAAQAYMKLASEDASGASYFRLRAAEAWREEGSLGKADQALVGIDRKQLTPADAARFDLLRAEVALHKGDTAQALSLTAQTPPALSPSLVLRQHELRARALEAAGKPYQAARIRVGMDDQLKGLDQAENRRHIAQLLVGMGAPALRQHASELRPDAPMTHWVNEALGQLGVDVGRSSPQLDHPVGTVLPGSQRQQGYKPPHHVALLLPASGPLSAAAAVIREGFFAAYFQKRDDSATSDSQLQTQVKTYDAGTSPQQAVQAYQQAVADGADLVVGPLARDSVSAVLGQDKLPAPVLALNHPDTQQLPPANVTEFGLQPETEGRQVADHMAAQGLDRAVVLVSSEDFAQRAARAFSAQFKADGGQVVQQLSLDPRAINYGDQLKQLSADALGAKGGIFISMRPQQARLLMPQLRLAKLDAPAFATSHVYNGENDAEDNGDLNGLSFCDAPWLFNAQPGLPSRDAMASSLPGIRGAGARLFALGMDAWALAPYLDWLHNHPGSYLPGATGRLASDPFGRIHRELVWARFANGIAEPVAGSLQADTPSSGDLPAASPSSAQPAAMPAPATSSGQP